MRTRLRVVRVLVCATNSRSVCVLTKVRCRTYVQFSNPVPLNIITSTTARVLLQLFVMMLFGVVVVHRSRLNAEMIRGSVTLKFHSGPVCTFGLLSCCAFIDVVRRHSISQQPFTIHLAVIRILLMLLMLMPWDMFCLAQRGCGRLHRFVL